MKNEIKKFLDFNGTNIPVMSADGTIYVAIKPICSALGVDYIRQFKNVQEHHILSGVLSKQTTHDASGRLQEMVCLPERYIYGWLFSINSKSEDLIKYQSQCYDVLFDYFHGATTERVQLLRTKFDVEKRLKEAEAKLKEELLGLESFKEIKAIKMEMSGTKKGLAISDEKLLENQLKLFGEL